MENQCSLSFKQRIEDCKEEMQHMLPGFYKKVTDGVHTVIVESPTALERFTFRVREVN